MKINFKEDRKLYWLLNFFLFNIIKLSTCVFRNKTIWIFGAQAGMKYDDNSMYLFEYIYNTKKPIRAIWLTYKDEIVDQIRNKGYEAYNIKSSEGKSIALKAGVAFYTNGLDDFGKFPLIGGAKIVSLWHGVGLKKIYNETYSGLSLCLKKFLDFFFSWTYRNISIATSDYTKQKTIKQFNLKESNVYITGQPRNDLFKSKVSRSEVFKDINISDDKKILLYMPTYRTDDSLSYIINYIINNEAINKVLSEKNIVFVIKLHPKTSVNKIATLNENFILLKDCNVISNQKLIAVSDVLLTDYSSCFVDFALLNRPILFYTPDFNEYLNGVGELETEFYEKYLSNRANNTTELATLISNLGSERILKQTEITNKYFEDNSIKGTSYCENIYNLIYGKA
ncbi:CDP-glycerol glycerophosphotransferase [Dysgonomonadaceae bacterium PH5-43]|nr:CDP-glycerol glycerophosphotransferase [Dysgonomonadaceae bacterium PH5-43]